MLGLDQKNITIKNGTVRGFLTGIVLRGSGHIVEDMRVGLSTFIGINIMGVGSVVRNNLVVTTGGTTIFGSDASASGIEATGALHRILNNEVLDTFAVGTGFAPSIRVLESQGIVVEKNRAGNSTLPPTGVSFGVRAGGSNLLLVNNRFTLMNQAIACEGTVTMRDNLSVGTGGYFGCTDAGNNQ